ncbi:MAG: SDR family oxidoreductase [Eubacterium sp.]|nr:SDR family oxidoreductase [Eubacterium sp.]
MKRVLITGGATGIGKACAELFRDRGYDVVITYNKTLPEAENIRAVKCNLENVDEIKALFDEIKDIDILVNNAGISLIKMINNVTPEDFEKISAVNERAVYFCSKYAALDMIRKHSGAIINVSSIWGVGGASCETLYSMTKAAVIGLTKALSKELAPSNIRVNCVAPGIIETRMNDYFDKEELKSEVPLCRLGKPEEVANAILFLAENEYITGEILGVNGGII